MVLSCSTSIVTAMEVWNIIWNKGVRWMRADIAFYALGDTNMCVWWVTFEAFIPVNVHNLVFSVFFSIYHVMHTLLISCSPVCTPLISYRFSFDAYSTHLILSLLSSSALFLLHLVWSVLISYVFLTSNLLFCHLYFSAIFSSYTPYSHFMIYHLFSFYLCPCLVVLLIYAHFSSYHYASLCISFLLGCDCVLSSEWYHCFGRCTASVICVQVLNVKQEILVRTYYSCCPVNASVTTARQKEIIKNE